MRVLPRAFIPALLFEDAGFLVLSRVLWKVGLRTITSAVAAALLFLEDESFYKKGDGDGDYAEND